MSRKNARRTPENTAPGQGPQSHCSPIPRLAFSPDELAQSLGCSRDFLDEHIGPELRWIRRGRRKLVAVAEVERWLAETGARTLEADR